MRGRRSVLFGRCGAGGRASVRVLERPSLGEFDYHSRVVDEAALDRATDERPFTREAIACLEELSQSITVVAGLRRADAAGEIRPMTRNEAILAGLMVRCSKLQHAILAAAEQERIELLSFGLRGITEAAVNLRYLLECGADQEFDDFVRDSLRVDKKLEERILDNAARRSGVLLPIEDRMLTGIDRTFQVAGIDPASVDTSRDWRGWSKAAFGDASKHWGCSRLSCSLRSRATTSTGAGTTSTRTTSSRYLGAFSRTSPGAGYVLRRSSGQPGQPLSLARQPAFICATWRRTGRTRRSSRTVCEQPSRTRISSRSAMSNSSHTTQRAEDAVNLPWRGP